MIKTGSSKAKLILLGTIGGALEFFDFAIYALFATYLSQAFFPYANQFSALLNTFVIFAVGYLARPIGGLLFSHFGDRYGRKITFQTSIFIMTIATFLTGCLPTYFQVGVASTFLLVVLRIAQGISVGAEIPGATVFILEHIPERRGLAIGVIFMGITLGNVLASLLAYILAIFLTSEQMYAYGWRVGFIVGSLVGIIGYLLRRKFYETPLFLQFIEEQAQKKSLDRFPFLTLIKKEKKRVFAGINMMCLVPVSIFLIMYLPTYAHTILKQPLQQSYLLNIYMFLALSFFAAFFGYLSDYINRKKLLVFGIFATVITGFFLFETLILNDSRLIWLSSSLFVAGFGIYNGIYACTIAEMFKVSMRYTGMAFCYNIGFALFMSLSPVINAFLLKTTQNAFSPVFLLIIASFLSFSGVFLIRQQAPAEDLLQLHPLSAHNRE